MTDTALQDADARERALDCEQSFGVQAPAGSGKTALLTQRFLRLLARVEQPESILAITFTRKAAAEMRTRILSALSDAQSSVAPTNEFEAQLLADAKKALQRNDDAGWQLLEMPMRLQIMTVDSFNAGLVSAMPFSAKAASVSVSEDERLTELYANAADALLEWTTDSGPYADDATALFHFLDGDTRQWQRQLVELLATRERWLPVVLSALQERPEDLRAASEAQLRQIVVRRIRNLNALMPDDERGSLLALCQDAAARLGQPLVLDRWPVGDDPASLVGLQQLAGFCLTKTGDKFLSRLTKAQGFPPTAVGKAAKQSMQPLLDRLASIDGLADAWQAVRECPEPAYDDSRWALIVGMLNLLPLLAAELERLMSAAGSMDYPALAARAISALQDKAEGSYSQLAMRLDYRISHLLVDEMQDTSAAQYRLLDVLTEGWQHGDGRTLFCVGDPMQSIYRFRGAEVSRFLSLWQNGIGQLSLEPLTLTTNFRSDATIVGWVNDAFSVVMGIQSDGLMDQVAYSPATTRPGASDSGQVTWNLAVDPPDDSSEAQRIVERIVALQRQDADASIAVLCRSRSHVESVAHELQRCDVAYDAIEMQRLGERDEVLDLISLTRAFSHRGDRIAWLGLLRSPLVGFSFDEIDVLALSTERTLVDALEALVRDGSSAFSPLSLKHARHLLAIYRQFLVNAATDNLRSRIERAFAGLGGYAVIDNAASLDAVDQCLALVDDLDNGGQLGSIQSLETALARRRVTQGGAPATRVSLMTIYKAKGLEFDHVIVPAIDRASRNDPTKAMVFELPSGSDGASPSVLFSMPTARQQRHVAGDPLHALLGQRERIRRGNELDRLLYVAATRARKTLHWFGTLVTKQDGHLRQPGADTFWARLAPVADVPLPDEQPSKIVDETTASAFVLPLQRQLSQPWRTETSPWQVPVATAPTRVSQEAVSFRWAGTTARHVGTVVHTWLQHLAGAPDVAALVRDELSVRRRSVALLRREGVAEADLEPASSRVWRALQQTISSPEGYRLLSNTHPDSAAELALSGVLDGELLHAVIVRVIRDDDGVLWVVDYKTSSHEGGDIEAFFENELARYNEQLRRYQRLLMLWYRSQGRAEEAVRRALFFPNYARLQRYADD